MKNKKVFNGLNCVPIVGTAAIATDGVSDGRAIPVMIIDCENHKEVLNLISNHPEMPGDCVSCWGVKSSWFSPKDVFLSLIFTNPVDLEIILKFNLSKHHMIADGIVNARAVYLQTNILGDKFNSMEMVHSEKILVEVPASTQLPNWDDILIKLLTKKVMKGGLKRKAARDTAYEHLTRSREFWGNRMEEHSSNGSFEINKKLSRF